jgi:RNA polymerase sigma-70 factor (ECF subfamily)
LPVSPVYPGENLVESRLQNEERLLIEAAQKDPRRFAELYEAHVDRVYAYIARRMHDRTEAEDLTSEVFQQALARIGQFEWRGAPFAAWLFRIAGNAIADRWQRLGREAREPEEPDSVSEGVERRVLLAQLVDRLPYAQRRVIQGRFVEQRSIREIAEELDKSEGAIKQLQFRALENLRAQLGGSNG